MKIARTRNYEETVLHIHPVENHKLLDGTNDFAENYVVEYKKMLDSLLRQPDDRVIRVNLNYYFTVSHIDRELWHLEIFKKT